MSMVQDDDLRKKRVEQLREVIMELHAGKTVDEVKAKFKDVIQGVTAQEISAMEQSLIEQGIPVEEVQRLCDVHASVFADALELQPDPKAAPGHPMQVFMEENRALERVMEEKVEPALKAFREGAASAMEFLDDFNLLFDVDKHYKRKEEGLFPLLEKYGVYGPTKVMWGVDDEIRASLKEARAKLLAFDGTEGARADVAAAVEKALRGIKEMIFKEEKIFLPMADQHFKPEEWRDIALASREIGYCLVEPDAAIEWIARFGAEGEGASLATAGDVIHLPTGALTVSQLELMLNSLPIDITFVDENDTVRYFSASRERIFTRPKTIIGRKVQNCHPPTSVHVVEQILESFRRGERDVADFWIHMGPKFVYIRYFAVRDAAGEYRCPLEVSQEISGIKALEGEKRLLDW